MHTRPPSTVRFPILLLLVSVALAACTPGASSSGGEIDRARASITAEALRAHTEFLADDLLEGREVGTRGGRLAALYIASQYAETGLQPGGDGGGWFQRVPLRRSVLDMEESRLAITPAGGETRVVSAGDWAGSPRFGSEIATLEGEAVFVGYGVHAPDLGHSDYQEADVAGKVAVALWGAPPSLGPDQAAHFRSGKAAVALAHGAVGLVQLATPALEQVAPWNDLQRIAARPAVTWVDAEGRVRGIGELDGSAILSPARSAALLATAGTSFEEAVSEAATPGAGRPIPVRFTMSTVSRIEGIEGRNVVGVVPAAPQSTSDEIVVVTAHFDHDGIGPAVGGDSIYNGALDNAAAIGSMLEVAEALAASSPSERAVWLVATDAEEKGLLGAEFFAANPPVPVERVAANVNMDGNHMLFPTADIVALGSDRSTLGAAVEAAASTEELEVSPDPMPEQGFFTRSDHYPFVKRGIPAVFLIGGFRSTDPTIDGLATMQRWLATTYHTPADDLSQDIHWESGVTYTRIALRIVMETASAGEAPTWNPGDFFGETFGPGRIGQE